MHASLFSRLFYPALLLLLVAGLTGCGEDGVSPDDTTKPGIGSTYTVAGYYTDAAGTPNPLSYDTSTTTLSEIHASFKGKSDVHEFTNKFGSSFLAYDDDGDIHMLFQATLNGQLDSVWLELPAGSGTESTQEVASNIQTLSPGTVYSSVLTAHSTRGASREFTINGTTLTAQEVTVELENMTIFTVDGDVVSQMAIYTTLTAYYAPAIGMTVQQESEITDSDGNPIGTGSFAAVIDYELK